MTDYSRMARVYQKIREKRTELKKAFEEEDRHLKEKLEMLEAEMISALSDMGVSSLRTDNGTIFTQEDVKASVDDWGVYVDWMKDNDAFEMVQKRPAIREVRQYMEEHGEIPPGLSVHRTRVVRVRKS